MILHRKAEGINQLASSSARVLLFTPFTRDLSFLIQHLYSASALVLRRGRPKQGPTLGGVSTEGIWP